MGHGSICPSIWRTPTASNTLSPKWHASHSFRFNWTKSKKTPEREEPRRTRRPSNSSQSASGSPMDQVVNLVHELQMELKQTQEEVSTLRGRISELSSKGRALPLKTRGIR